MSEQDPFQQADLEVTKLRLQAVGDSTRKILPRTTCTPLRRGVEGVSVGDTTTSRVSGRVIVQTTLSVVYDKENLVNLKVDEVFSDARSDTMHAVTDRVIATGIEYDWRTDEVRYYDGDNPDPVAIIEATDKGGYAMGIELIETKLTEANF